MSHNPTTDQVIEAIATYCDELGIKVHIDASGAPVWLGDQIRQGAYKHRLSLSGSTAQSPVEVLIACSQCDGRKRVILGEGIYSPCGHCDGTGVEPDSPEASA